MIREKIAVAVKCLIENEKSEFLILEKSVEEAKNDRSESLYDIPGGRLEYGETLIDAISREVREETSLNLDRFTLLDVQTIVRKDGLQLMILAYYSKVKEEKIVLSNEHCNFLWVSKEEINKKIPLWIVEYIKKVVHVQTKETNYEVVKKKLGEKVYDEKNMQDE